MRGDGTGGDGDRLRRRPLRVVDHGTGDPPRLQGSVGVVHPIGEGLPGIAQPLRLGGVPHGHGGREPHEHQFPPGAGDRPGERPGERRVADRLVVERAVRLHMGERGPPGVDEGGERPHLVEHIGLDLLGRRLDRPPPEPAQVVVPRMGAHRHPPVERQPDGPVHDRRVPGVEPAGHIRRGDDLQDLLVAADRVVPETLAQIAVEVYPHDPPILRRPERRSAVRARTGAEPHPTRQPAA